LQVVATWHSWSKKGWSVREFHATAVLPAKKADAKTLKWVGIGLIDLREIKAAKAF